MSKKLAWVLDEMSVFLKGVYTVFIGILLATTVGVGIQAFYPPPKAPEAPSPQVPYPQAATASAQLTQQEDQYNKDWRAYNSVREDYEKNVSIIATVFAILLLIVSVSAVQKVAMIADGTLLGGLITELYSIFRGFMSGDDKVRFLVVGIGLIVAIFLGYTKFVKAEGKRKR